MALLGARGDDCCPRGPQKPVVKRGRVHGKYAPGPRAGGGARPAREVEAVDACALAEGCETHLRPIAGAHETGAGTQYITTEVRKVDNPGKPPR